MIPCTVFLVAVLFLLQNRESFAFLNPLAGSLSSNEIVQKFAEKPTTRTSLSSESINSANGEDHVGKNFPGGNGEDDESDNLLSDPSAASRLSHAMLQVPSVDKTVSYWKETASAKITASSKLEKTQESGDELRSAFVVLGNGKSIDNCFALELVKNKHKTFELGNAISYLGVSKLIQYANTKDLLQVLTGNAEQPPTEQEPNGIEVSSCASAPGDFFARFCLHAEDMEATRDFYTAILGMKVAAVDEGGKMLCLRYASPMRSSGNDKKKKKEEASSSDGGGKSTYGVPTTLVFEPLSATSSPAAVEKGNCFDHLVISTQANMDAVNEQLQTLLEERSDLNCSLFMKPTEMFGQKVIGVMDPNGYKIIVAGKV